MEKNPALYGAVYFLSTSALFVTLALSAPVAAGFGSVFSSCWTSAKPVVLRKKAVATSTGEKATPSTTGFTWYIFLTFFLAFALAVSFGSTIVAMHAASWVFGFIMLAWACVFFIFGVWVKCSHVYDRVTVSGSALAVIPLVYFLNDFILVSYYFLHIHTSADVLDLYYNGNTTTSTVTNLTTTVNTVRSATHQDLILEVNNTIVISIVAKLILGVVATLLLNSDKDSIFGHVMVHNTKFFDMILGSFLFIEWGYAYSLDGATVSHQVVHGMQMGIFCGVLVVMNLLLLYCYRQKVPIWFAPFMDGIGLKLRESGKVDAKTEA